MCRMTREKTDWKISLKCHNALRSAEMALAVVVFTIGSQLPIANCQVSLLPCYNACYYILTSFAALARTIGMKKWLHWWWYTLVVARLKYRVRARANECICAFARTIEPPNIAVCTYACTKNENCHIHRCALWKSMAILSVTRFGIRYNIELIANSSNVTEHIINW